MATMRPVPDVKVNAVRAHQGSSRSERGQVPMAKVMPDEDSEVIGLRPVLTIDPRRQFGDVCIDSGRVPASVVARCVVAGDSVDSVAEGYAITREQVLVACWWYGDICSHARRPLKIERKVAVAWGCWLDEALHVLGGHKDGPLADPPEIGD